jgi:hypothetical protein
LKEEEGRRGGEINAYICEMRNSEKKIRQADWLVGLPGRF